MSQPRTIPQAGIILSVTLPELQDMITTAVNAAVAAALKQERSNATATELLTYKQAAALLQVSVTTLQLWAKQGKVNKVRVGTSGIRFRRADIVSAVQNGTLSKYSHS